MVYAPTGSFDTGYVEEVRDEIDATTKVKTGVRVTITDPQSKQYSVVIYNTSTALNTDWFVDQCAKLLKYAAQNDLMAPGTLSLAASATIYAALQAQGASADTLIAAYKAGATFNTASTF